ncbi:MAG: phytanoyl-CoA dioxygenase family protein [bacterium]|nr:phytanoyl-CoA dioxygenase family protein [bacterium]
MHIDRDRFLEEGYLIVRNVVSLEALDGLRKAYEILVEHQKQTWAQERNPGDPPGGVWETSRQPRLHLHRPPLAHQIDKQSGPAIEIWLHENMQGVSSQLLGVKDAAVTEMMMMCSPQSDHGPAQWHRDMYPPYAGPLQGYIEDILESGPRYVQWNLSLYDDDVLWVVPGSHVRVNTPEEDARILEDPGVPLPGSVQTHLNAGDGVVYILPILHWGSNYSTRLRRCIHGGFSEYAIYQEQGYIQHLSPDAQSTFARWIRHSEEMQDHTEIVLRAALEKNGAGYYTALENLHPGRGEKGKLLSTVFLSKTVQRIYNLKRPDFDRLPAKVQGEAIRPHPMTLDWGRPFAERFTPGEARSLLDRFEPIDTSLQSDQEQFAPGFQGANSPYFFNEMPTDIDLDRFIASWET